MRWGFATLLLSTLTLSACDPGTVDEISAGSAREPDALSLIEDGPHDMAALDMGELGTIRIELLPELAPQTVENFVKLAESGSYDGTTFHRVIPGFMIQGGDPASKNLNPHDDGDGGPGYSIQDEFTDYPHVRGTVSMANKGRPDSGGSQFFITHQDVPALDGAYAVFGRVVEGFSVVDAITELEIDIYGRYGPENRPYPVSAIMESLSIDRAAGNRSSPRSTQTTAVDDLAP
jgi:cyclophilin family peptidyl-prolyl cis-trans isomerase